MLYKLSGTRQDGSKFEKRDLTIETARALMEAYKTFGHHSMSIDSQ